MKHDHVADVCVRDVFASNPDRNPLLVRQIDGEIAPVEWLAAVRRAKVFPHDKTRLSLRHRFSFSHTSNSPPGGLVPILDFGEFRETGRKT